MFDKICRLLSRGRQIHDESVKVGLEKPSIIPSRFDLDGIPLHGKPSAIYIIVLLITPTSLQISYPIAVRAPVVSRGGKPCWAVWRVNDPSAVAGRAGRIMVSLVDRPGLIILATHSNPPLPSPAGRFQSRPQSFAASRMARAIGIGTGIVPMPPNAERRTDLPTIHHSLLDELETARESKPRQNNTGHALIRNVSRQYRVEFEKTHSCCSP